MHAGHNAYVDVRFADDSRSVLARELFTRREIEYPLLGGDDVAPDPGSDREDDRSSKNGTTPSG